MDKYHDRAFEKVGKHSPSWHRRHDRPQQQQRQRRRSPDEESRTDHEVPSERGIPREREVPRERDTGDSGDDMYAPDRRQERDYQGRDRRDSRYVSDETFYYRGPDAGAVAMRDSDPYKNARGYEVSVSDLLFMKAQG